SPSDDAALSYVTIGRNLGAKRDDAINGWYIDAETILPMNEQAADFVGALRLELARSLGVQVLLDGTKFAENISDPNAWTLHLVDGNGNYASEGKKIVTSAELGDRDAADFFVADKTIYFVGDNVSEVLSGATFDGVSGIPINAWDSGNFDGVQTLIPGLMTALPYKNYSTFTELELAALQDIGYDIDRKKFYGLSIYKSGATIDNTQNFTSDEDLAVGLHIFGANNTVNQSGNINLTGTGAVGIRVDGEKNNLTIPAGTEISSSGLRGKGLLVSYGREQNLTVDGNIFATGEGGNAVEFNFGSNALGAGGEYRGSYLRYLRYVNSSGTIAGAVNLPLTMTDGFNYYANELNGALVNDFNLSGKIQGSKNAIYIGKNAFVRNINVNAGAQIIGDITSDWKNFTAEDGFSVAPVEIQYDGKSYDAEKYIPDLATNLNFNTDLSYDGNINGANNIRMNVNEGTLNFSGTADILSVEVMGGAKLFGGTFTLNDMRFDIADGFSDSLTGKFINHGTIGAGSKDTNLVINGDLISDGILQRISGGTGGKIIVNGNANINGSTITTDSLLPNETETVL
ncbi:MAG: autotransporter outer membrane beta-barrel domain-containing protein, partial [Selenomonadaceae bacterium]|nr:autotransporter outer membrane beta-barrel domain-containing protein [Selenomonadaceae bacterium]